MKRLIDYYLADWMKQSQHKPLLLRGARQVGKTHAARKLGTQFTSFIEINVESDHKARAILEEDLDVNRVVLQLGEYANQAIIPGQTLLFFMDVHDYIREAVMSLVA